MPARLIDAHTHFFSRVFFDTLAGMSPQPGTVDVRLERVTKRAALALPSADNKQHLKRWLDALDEGGVDHAVTFASLPQEADVVSEAVAHSGGRLTGYVLVNPKTDPAGEVTRAHFEKRGFRGILLFPAQHHYSMRDALVRPVLKAVADHGGVVVVHCGMLKVKLKDMLGLPNTVDLRFANPLDIVPAALSHPAAHFVIPHFGAGFFRECLVAGDMASNVLVDTSSSNAWMSTQPAALDLDTVFLKALQVYGPSRVLFGTDSSTFPRGWRNDIYALQREVIARCGLTDDEQAMIVGGNVARLLGL